MYSNNPLDDVKCVEGVLGEILQRTEMAVRRDGPSAIRNERFFHHMFTTFLAARFASAKRDLWNELALRPEWPTAYGFKWDGIRLDDVNHTRTHAISPKRARGTAQSGNFDFVYVPSPDKKFAIEWKGPNLYSVEDVAQVMLKLLYEKGPLVRVFAAIVTSSITGKRGHAPALQRALSEGLRFACEVKDDTDLAAVNLYVYVASIHRGHTSRICWGECSSFAPDSWAR